MGIPVSRQPRRGADRKPVDWAAVGRTSVRRRARGMTHSEVQTALEEARLSARLDSRHEELATDERGPAELTEWRRIAQLLTDTDAPYNPDHDAHVQDELTAEAEHARLEQLAADQRRQEDEADTARRAALDPNALHHALLRTLAHTQLLDTLSEDEQLAIGRLPHTDPAAAFAVNALLARAYAAGQAAEHNNERG
ncbi:hypothetical protein [Streptomyces sp. H27-D2]|uniref:hypothetical protein n=1 Tax=Streptomyces sp. H27-D2 TaxID=3046304 RepID=UPI002DBA6666|nr:hypothetical protein [Streptomyces sp. H27-D2]MEC4020565.1 hypothetical protein [Streptomyces sp. H27-D2]